MFFEFLWLIFFFLVELLWLNYVVVIEYNVIFLKNNVI